MLVITVILMLIQTLWPSVQHTLELGLGGLSLVKLAALAVSGD